jgi:hypothetical protein
MASQTLDKPSKRFPRYLPSSRRKRYVQQSTFLTKQKKTRELESIIALKSRQISRLQKEVKNLLKVHLFFGNWTFGKIQQQQAHTIEASFEDSRELEVQMSWNIINQ